MRCCERTPEHRRGFCKLCKKDILAELAESYITKCELHNKCFLRKCKTCKNYWGNMCCTLASSIYEFDYCYECL